MLLLAGCVALSYTLLPHAPPAGTLQGALPGHYLSQQEPRLLSISEWFNLYRHTEWRGIETFTSTVVCLGGLPQRGGPRKRCLQWYGGVKVDGSESLAMQAVHPGWWDYVYIKKEQSAFRITDIGYPDPYDMGGS